MKLEELGEFKLIERIRQQVNDGAGVQRGIGDDAATLKLPDGHNLLTSTDMLIEGVHFRRDWTSCKDLGHKAVAVNLSDIAAMGGSPHYLYLSFACPGDTNLNDIQDFLNGALDEAKEHNVTLVGGDTCRSPGPWIISVTIEGSAPAGCEIGRNGAKAGDLIMVSGTLGDSALALHRLSNNKQADTALLMRHHRPKARVNLGRLLGEHQVASAMIDLSDGLTGDLEHILQASQVDGLIEESSLPLSAPLQKAIEKEPELQELALFGGEDYELLFTVAPEMAEKAGLLANQAGLNVTVIGSIQTGSGALSLRNSRGEVRPLLVRSYDHFCRS